MNPSKTAELLLNAKEICVLSTLSPSGDVHAMPMWFIYDDARIWFLTQHGSQKWRNVGRTGKATITLDRRSRPYHAIMIQGRAEAGGPLSREQQYAIIRRYLDEAAAWDYVDTLAARGGNASIVVTPSNVVEFNTAE